MIALDRAFSFETGTRIPYFPFSSISDGPDLQSVYTTLVPHAKASTITFPKPS